MMQRNDLPPEQLPYDLVEEAYTATVIDHASNPRNAGSIPNADGYGSDSGDCGDTLEMWLRVSGNKVVNATFWTDGCGGIVACGSVATELAKGKEISRLVSLCQDDILSVLGGLPEDQIHCAQRAAAVLRLAALSCLKPKQESWRRAYRKG
jgi:nitrogen fixation NifU-like protein